MLKELHCAYMIGDEDVERTDLGKEAHFVDGDDDGVDNLVLEGLENDGAIFDAKLDGARARAILNDALSDAFVAEHGDNVAVAAGAVALDLSEQCLLQETGQRRAEMLWRERNCMLQLLLQEGDMARR